jgi:F-type H+-transporting ATPase subunit a
MQEISLKAEELFHLGSFPITNSLILTMIVSLIFLLFSLFFRKKFSVIPGKIQNLLEILFESFLNLMDSILGDRKKSEKFLPLIVTIFLVILLSNWLGLMPGVGSIILRIGDKSLPIFRSPSADLNFTLALAILAVFSVNIIGMMSVGIFKYLGKFFTLKNPIYTFVGFLELISEVAKMISFSFRLFGNIFAGEVLLIIVSFLVPYIIPLPFLFLEFFVGMIQAFIFSMLTLVFIAIAITQPEH